MFNGFPGADTVRVGYNHLGQQVQLTAIPLNGYGDWQHSRTACMAAYDGGKMDGFDLDTIIGTKQPPSNYTYAQASDLTTYWSMASSYTLADRMFASNCGSSFPAHQFLIAGQTGLEYTPFQKPWGCDSTPPHCFDYLTLGDLLDTAGVSWKYYSNGTALDTPTSISGLMAYDAISHIRYGSDWSTNHIGIPETTVLNDIQSGNLAGVSWVTPNGANSDHHGVGGVANEHGQAWVASIIDAVGQSKYWNSTAIFVTWDDYGGWYDHVAPQELYSDGLGFRVPLIVISPYAKHGYISHVNHEFGSILRFTEETFNLPSLGTRDKNSDDLSDCFNFNQSPGGFSPFVHGVFDTTDTTSPDDD